MKKAYCEKRGREGREVRGVDSGKGKGEEREGGNRGKKKG